MLGSDPRGSKQPLAQFVDLSGQLIQERPRTLSYDRAQTDLDAVKLVGVTLQAIEGVLS